jgi:protein-arginine kinase activator protein McsA
MDLSDMRGLVKIDGLSSVWKQIWEAQDVTYCPFCGNHIANRKWYGRWGCASCGKGFSVLEIRDDFKEPWKVDA